MTSPFRKLWPLNYYQRLKWNIFMFMFLVVCIPLPIVAGTIYRYYQTYVLSTVEQNLQGVVEKRREAIEVFLSEKGGLPADPGRVGLPGGHQALPGLCGAPVRPGAAPVAHLRGHGHDRRPGPAVRLRGAL